MAFDASVAIQRITPAEIMVRKGGQPIVSLTAYTYPIARLLDPHVDLLLVGDSVAMVLYGYPNTLSATMDMMIAHGQAVIRGTTHACVVVDMPAGSYEDSVDNAVRSAKRIVSETGCDAVKLEGGMAMAPHIAAIVAADIPVMGHIGLLPQLVEKEGGYKIKGRSDDNIAALHDDACAVEAAGAFSVVIEGTVETVAADISALLLIPTIGIGASPKCDGQIMVIDDAIGLTVDRVPKFVKEYTNLRNSIAEAAEAYARDVRNGAFPTIEHLFMPKDKQ